MRETPPASEQGHMLDASALPSFAFGHRSLMWWSTLCLIAIESTVFALAVASYFYLRSHAPRWPLSTPAPDLLWGSLNTGILLASTLPNHWLKQAGEAGNLPRMRLWFVVCLVFSLAFLGVRALEFTTLNVRWDTDAYGSIVWMLLALHTVHLITDTWDTGVLAVLMFTGPLEGQRRVDTSENAQYWYFVVLSWLPIYTVLYWAPRVS
ncbi:cytochrome c oxidase subunit 3 [Aquabacterium sp.]|uniref:cytochrome c oxidase subunit 3 n=1 Tax=Aquabacterium sp. TaxID=1872578 RepID=UPI003D6CACBC